MRGSAEVNHIIIMIIIISIQIWNSVRPKSATSSVAPSKHPPPPSHLKDYPGAWLDDTQLLVFAAGGQQAAVCVEGHAEDDVSVAVDHFHWLADLQVPDQDLTQ